MKILSTFLFIFCCVPWAYSQAGHIMQGVGAVNMSMGGAATAQPLDISGALHWNPATLTTFDQGAVGLDIGLFFSSPELRSTVPEVDGNGQPTGNFISGLTEDDRGVSPLPALSYVPAAGESKHHFGFSAFGISGFGVTFPESNSNPINMPQNMGGFGRIESDYSLLQFGVAWAYELSETFSIGIQPNLNYASLELLPNPTGNPTGAGYPRSDRASAMGFGAQIGIFYDSGSGFKAGTSYKTKQHFGAFEFNNTYLDNSEGTNEFTLDYPAIWSLGLGYSLGNLDLALDYRLVNYENTESFDTTGWSPTFTISGFGWKNVNIISAGLQYKGIHKMPIRLGYTYSSNPITSETAFFNIPATAIIKNAFQLGLGLKASDHFELNGVFHYGFSGDATAGPMYNPQFIQDNPPYGAVPGSEVSYEMTTSMLMFGARYSW
ncbi:outer membrane protein transport protein [Robiginitalea sp. M366]|uniref:OmpP1/FadL family transporter n=1 Tax=Robiginitalea aestuariiviva TaxID=3036903 RepID=UPI00240D5026|nr:outer membrane protein transport protein [Robiginitalea aestuariiviva]MDG1570966.1 outer membrane protein transport protein [Robiginitalea aestuariiviva]